MPTISYGQQKHMNVPNDKSILEVLKMFVDSMLSQDFDNVDVTEFFGVLAAMDEAEPETIELTAHLGTGKAYDASCHPELLP